MLRVIADDLRTSQTEQQQIEKARGLAPSHGSQTAAETHAVARLTAGFTLVQMVSEYRALRASVLSLWMPQIKEDSNFELRDITRFNEAIDQALAESIASYSRAIEASRSVFLGTLGHDLRSPFGAISLGADILLRTQNLGDHPTKISAQISTSVKRASQIVSDLLDFTRLQLGPGIPVQVKAIDLSAVCTRMVDEARAFHLDANIVYTASPVQIGNFDGDRMEQVFSNLISNAVTHGDVSSPITVTLRSNAETLEFSVHNQGQPIAEDALPFIFNPMERFSQHATDCRPNTGLGLDYTSHHKS